MAKILPSVRLNAQAKQATLSAWQDQQPLQITLDGPQWINWLAQEQPFRLTYQPSDGDPFSLNIRPEKRGQRTYWQAWKTIKGQTRKKYLAPTAKLTQAKLDDAGQWFHQQIQAQLQQDPAMLFYAAAIDLIWLVEQLLEPEPEPALFALAKTELQRIKAVVGH